MGDEGLGQRHLDRAHKDKDGDGLTNEQEGHMKGTYVVTAGKQAFKCEFILVPTLALNSSDNDTDNDTWRDGAECELGSDPTDAGKTPEICDGANNDGDALTDEVPTATGLFLDYTTNPALCAPADPDGDGAAGITENKIRTKNRIKGEWEDLPDGALPCDANVSCDADNDALNYDMDPDSDNDGKNDLEEFGKYGTSSVNAYSDSDTCSDGEELGPNKNLGGLRNPKSDWDFFDVNNSKNVDGTDVAVVKSKFGRVKGVSVDYIEAYDRSGGVSAWAPGPPNGAIDGTDVALVKASFGHSCIAAP
jgi:hypothetical protein